MATVSMLFFEDMVTQAEPRALALWYDGTWEENANTDEYRSRAATWSTDGIFLYLMYHGLSEFPTLKLRDFRQLPTKTDVLLFCA